jgi:peptidoglycan hydrolase FlgJ
MTVPVADASVYTESSGLAALKRAARSLDPKAIREVARQFESVFARMMLKSMRDANFKDPLLGSDQQDFYQGMFDDQLAMEITKGHGLGLADMLVQQLTRAGLVPAGSANTRGTAEPTAGASATAAPAAGTAAPGAPQTATLTTAQTDFVRAIWPAAEAAGRQLGVDPRTLVAQAALETGWGRAVPSDSGGHSSFNLLGIKAGVQWSGASVSARTFEIESGVPVARTDRFRAYGSSGENFQDYVALLRNSPRYVAALNTGDDTAAFATALQKGGYSTDPAYAQKLVSIAQNLNGTIAALKSADAGPIDPAIRMPSGARHG